MTSRAQDFYPMTEESLRLGDSLLAGHLRRLHPGLAFEVGPRECQEGLAPAATDTAASGPVARALPLRDQDGPLLKRAARAA